MTHNYDMIMMSQKFLPAVPSPIREREDSQSFIHHYYIRINLNLDNITGCVIKSRISDHYPVILNIEMLTTTTKESPKVV